MSFNKLGLNSELLKALTSKGYKSPTPIQEQAIPAVLSGKDIRGAAQTGTGKTAAFTLPILQILSEQKYRSKQPRVLILTPTRELAAQIGDNLDIYGKNLPFRSTTVFGGVNINPQKSELRRGVDIVIATPGRLLDHAGQGSINLSQIQILVLDEADRMLDMGFINDIKKVIRYLPRKRQNLLFSATYSDKIKELSDELLNNPLEIEVAARNTAAESIQQIVHPVEKNKKLDLLVQLVKEKAVFQALVFTRTKYGADKLAKHLSKQGIKSQAIHGNKTQAARTKTLADFKKSKLQILVATDIASRGLDINQLPYVFNYDLPEVAEDYVHRIGRTGRADAEGVAVSFVTGSDQHLLRGIEKLLNKKLELVKIDGFAMGPEEQPQKKQNQPRRSRGFVQPRSSSNSYSRKPRQRRERREQKPKILLVETF